MRRWPTLAEEFGTPLFVYDEAQLRARCREAVAAFGDGVAYATKAFLCRAMARLAHEEGMHLDVASGGELHVALSAGVPAERLVLHGNNKSDDELRTAREVGVGRIVVDSFDELDRLERLYGADGIVPEVLLRITPGVEAHTHEFVMTGQDDSKFGFGLQGRATPPGPSSGPRRRRRRAGRHPRPHRLAGLRGRVLRAGHRGAGPVRQRATACPSCRSAAASASPTSRARRRRRITEWGDVVRGGLRARRASRARCRPSRAGPIAAAAGVTVYRVGTIKDVPGIRTFVAVDGGFIDNPRPALYGSGYETFLPAGHRRRPHRGRPRWSASTASPATCWCARPRCPPGVAVGDLLATPVTGAYGRSMGSNYNLLPAPGVVFVADGEARLVIRRETDDDLLRHRRRLTRRA